MSQGWHQGWGTAATRANFPVKQHLNGTKIEAHLRLGAWPSRLFIFWVLGRDSSLFTLKWLKFNAGFLCSLYLRSGGRLTTSHQNELSLKYDIFKVTYTSISEQFSKHIIKTLNQRLSQINSLSSSTYELNEIRCANIFTWLGFITIFVSSITSLYLFKETSIFILL